MKRLAAIALAVAAFAARAATTNEVDVAALIAAVEAGQSETNGWTLSGLGKYAKGTDYTSNPACVKFDSLNDWLLSPDFGAQIIRIDATNRCTSTVPTRWLHVLDVKGAAESDLGCFPACLAEKRAEYQSFAVDAELSVSRVKLLLDGSGGTGVWGIGSLKIITADSVYAPSNLQVSHNGGDWCTLSWENGENTVSNRVETYLVEHGIGEDVIFKTEFNEFSAIDIKNPVRFDETLPTIDSNLSGAYIYAPTNTSGICQVGGSDNVGYLRYAGCSDYTNVVLRFSAKRYPEKYAKTKIWYELGGTTNEIAELNLTDDFSESVVNLSNVSNGAAILIGYDPSVSSGNRRVILDSLEIVRTNTLVTTTSPVDSRWIPATSGAVSFSTKDHEIVLVPKSEYRFEVRAQNADGLVSDPAVVDVVLDSLPGFRFILR